MKKLFLFLAVFAIFIFLAFTEENYLADAKPHEYTMYINELPVENLEEVGYFLFEPNSSNSLMHEDLAFIKLNSIASYLMNKHIAFGQIHVTGYTANAKIDINPYDLSIQRVSFIINELTSRGVPKHWFANPAGYGETEQWGNNETEIGRNYNRRVTVLIEPQLHNYSEQPLYFTNPHHQKIQKNKTGINKNKLKFAAVVLIFFIAFLLVSAIILNFLKYGKNINKNAVVSNNQINRNEVAVFDNSIYKTELSPPQKRSRFMEMEKAIREIISSIPLDSYFDVHTIVEIFLQEHDDVYLMSVGNYTSAAQYHSKISTLIAENTDLVELTGSSYSKNIHDKFSECHLFKRI